MATVSKRVVTLKKMPMPDYSKAERGEIFERGERVILVDGVRWGRTRVKSHGSRGTRTTFHQDEGDTILRELRPGKFVDEYVDSASKRGAMAYIGGKYQLPPDFKTTEQLILEKAQELVDAGRLRDPETVKAEVAERRSLIAKRRADAQAHEDLAFAKRAVEATEMSDVELHDHPGLVERIVAAMRWAQGQ